MKKQALIILIALVPAVSFAKVSDFNALITENMNAQSALHNEVQGHVKAAKADSNIRERMVFVENTSGSYNAPTRGDMLAFKKEKTFHRASEQKQFERLATEVNSAGE